MDSDSMRARLLLQKSSRDLPQDYVVEKKKLLGDMENFTFAIERAERELNDARERALAHTKDRVVFQIESSRKDVYQLNVEMARAARQQAIIVSAICDQMSSEGIRHHLDTVLGIMKTMSKIILLVHYRLVWQNQLEIRWQTKRMQVNWIEIKAKTKTWFNRICEFIQDHTKAYYCVSVVAGIALGVIFSPWVGVLVFFASVFAERLIFRAESKDTVWDPELAKKIHQVTEDISNSKVSLEEVKLLLDSLYDTCQKVSEPIVVQECSVCYEEFDHDQHMAVRFDNQGCRHIFCLSCANEVLKNKDCKCPLCRRDVSSTRTICPVCHEFETVAGMTSCLTCESTTCDACYEKNHSSCVYCLQKKAK